MEDSGTSRSITDDLWLARSRSIVSAPKDYFLAPIFAATPQKGAREVTVGNHAYLIGGFHPMDGAIHPPALDVRHARVIFSLLYFRSDYYDPRLIRFSFNELCMRYAESNGGRYARAIKTLMRELMDSYIRITDRQTNVSREFRLIERIDIEKRPPRRRDSKLALSGQREMWFNGCELSPEFAGMLSNFKELQDLNLDVFNSIRSPLAQAIFLYLPSRAHHHSEADPFEITLTNLLRQVSANVPLHKSKRRELFTQNRNSVITQLDGIETLSGVFRVKLAETSDGSDYKLQTWVERTKRKKPSETSSKLLNAFLKSGRTPEQFDQAMANIRPLSEYELGLLTTAKVEIEKNLVFLKRAKAILKDAVFSTLLAEAKGYECEGQKATKNQTARLIYRIMEAIATPFRPRTELGNNSLDN